MIETIVRIAEIGTFYGFEPEKPVALRKLSLIYGPNGTGKTTLCAILRSLARNEPDILLGRKTLNGRGDSRVELGLSGGGRCVWDGKAWSGDRPKIEIFDEQFVRENLYTDTVEVDHKRNLYRVIVGEEGVAITKKIEDETEKGKQIQNKITDITKRLQELVGTDMQLGEFLSLEKDPAVEQKIEEQRKKVAAHENAERLRKEKGLEPLPLPEALEGLDALLGRRFEDLAEDAERSLQRHLDECGRKPGHREWLERGLS